MAYNSRHTDGPTRRTASMTHTAGAGDPGATGNLRAGSTNTSSRAARSGLHAASSGSRATRRAASSSASTGGLGSLFAGLTGRKGSSAANAEAEGSERARTRATRRSSAGTNFMRYANDNSVVKFLYEVTAGRYRPFFIAAVAIAIFFGIYFPVRDYYVAQRTNEILTEQTAIREKYQQTLEDDVNTLLSEQGIKDTARQKFGLVDEGESSVDVTGLDELLAAEKEAEEAGVSTEVPSTSSDASSGDGSGDASGSSDGADGSDAAASDGSDSGDSDTSDNSSDGSSSDSSDSSSDDSGDSSSSDSGDSSDSSSSDGSSSSSDSSSSSSSSDTKDESSDPTTSTELKEAIEAVGSDRPWYVQVLDAIFFFNGVDNQGIKSTGSSE